MLVAILDDNHYQKLHKWMPWLYDSMWSLATKTRPVTGKQYVKKRNCLEQDVTLNKFADEIEFTYKTEQSDGEITQNKYFN